MAHRDVRERDNEPVEILLVEDDEEDYLLTKDLLSRIEGAKHNLHWVDAYNSALEAIGTGEYDVCLVDYRLGADDGIELVRELVANGLDLPVIVLTGQGDRDADNEATRAGAADYLVKGEVSPALLERAIRYAMRSHADLRALRDQEKQLRQAQKMEAIGKLAGGIAHDFNNLLTVIRGYATLLRNELQDERLKEHAMQVDNAAEHGAELTRHLLAFSRQQVLRPTPTDLNVVIENTLKLLDRSIDKNIKLVRTLEPDLPTVTIDQGQLAQVILNLAINARDAMEDGGTLVLKTATVELDASYASKHVGVTPGPHVLLQVTDSGAGMDAETQSHVFDPFFTTKEEGTGLGLATVHGIVNQSGGHIWLYSEPGMGTTFKIYLPSADTPAIATTPVEPLRSLDGSETILLVEDAEIVRAIVAEILEPHGYTILAASNGTDALAIARNRHGAIDLLLTDVVMPGMNGRELAESLTAQYPDVKVLFSSGYPVDTVVRTGIADGTIRLIEKPYLPAVLARAVRETLDEESEWHSDRLDKRQMVDTR